MAAAGASGITLGCFFYSQVNLRGGTFGQAKDGVQYVKLPVNKI